MFRRKAFLHWYMGEGMDEVKAVTKAIEILSSDAVSANATGNLGTAEERLPGQPGEAATRVGHVPAGRSEAPQPLLRPSRDARRGGPLRKVRKMIQDLMVKLREDSNEEADHKGDCDAELAKLQSTVEKNPADSARLTAEVIVLGKKFCAASCAATSLTAAAQRRALRGKMCAAAVQQQALRGKLCGNEVQYQEFMRWSALLALELGSRRRLRLFVSTCASAAVVVPPCASAAVVVPTCASAAVVVPTCASAAVVVPTCASAAVVGDVRRLGLLTNTKHTNKHMLTNTSTQTNTLAHNFSRASIFPRVDRASVVP